MTNLSRPNHFGEGTTEITIALENYCTEGLRIPFDHIDHWDRPFDYDAYMIHCKNGCRFAISGPEMHAWKHGASIEGRIGDSGLAIDWEEESS